MITTRDLLRHPMLIVGGFGVTACWRCCKAVLLRRRTTFLKAVWR